MWPSSEARSDTFGYVLQGQVLVHWWVLQGFDCVVQIALVELVVLVELVLNFPCDHLGLAHSGWMLITDLDGVKVFSLRDCTLVY